MFGVNSTDWVNWFFLNKIDNMDIKNGFEMSLIVVEAIRGRCASFMILTATVSEIFGGQTNSSILVGPSRPLHCIDYSIETFTERCMHRKRFFPHSWQFRMCSRDMRRHYFRSCATVTVRGSHCCLHLRHYEMVSLLTAVHCQD